MKATINIYGDVHIYCDSRSVFVDDFEEKIGSPKECAPDTEDGEEWRMSDEEIEAMVNTVAQLLTPFLPDRAGE